LRRWSEDGRSKFRAFLLAVLVSSGQAPLVPTGTNDSRSNNGGAMAHSLAPVRYRAHRSAASASGPRWLEDGRWICRSRLSIAIPTAKASTDSGSAPDQAAT